MPWRALIGAIGLVLAALVLLETVLLAQRVIILIVIAGFFAIVLAPLVRAAQRRLHLHRGLAITLVPADQLVLVSERGAVLLGDDLHASDER